MAEVAKTRITAAFSDAVDPVMRLHLIEAVALERQGSLRARGARGVRLLGLRAARRRSHAPTLVDRRRTATGRSRIAWMEELAARIRGARLVRIPGAAHISNLERPQEFNRAVLEFLGV